jgi:hypothetical protein
LDNQNYSSDKYENCTHTDKAQQNGQNKSQQYGQNRKTQNAQNKKDSSDTEG